MLNVNEIAARIENPSITKAEDAEDLKLLTEKYPYTQLFSILYLQSLKQAGDIHFEDELKKHSYRITDRAQLFNLIESAHAISAEPMTGIEAEEKVEEVEELTISSAAVSDGEGLNDSKIEDVVNPVDNKTASEVDEVTDSTIQKPDSGTIEKVEPKTEVKENTDRIEVPESNIHDEEFPEELVNEVETESESIDTSENFDIPSEEIDSFTEEEETSSDIDTDAIAASEFEAAEIGKKLHEVEDEVEDEIWTSAPLNPLNQEKEELYSVEEAFKDESEGANDSKDQLDQTIEHHIYAANYRLDGLSPEEEQRLKEKEAQDQSETSIESEKDEIKENLSFTSWLQANDNYIEREEEVVTAQIVPEFSDFDPSNPLFGEQERPKKEFFSAPKKAKKSLTEETVPVSETLAKVYAMQGNYPKAIAAYEQLMLTIPEKKSFFASLIEDLKTKLNT